MASSYSSDELKGSGINLKEDLLANTLYTFNITSSATGQSYLFMWNELYDSTLPEYFSGSLISARNNVTGSITEPFKMGINTFELPNSSFNFQSLIDIAADDVKISATGDINLGISNGSPISFTFNYPNFNQPFTGIDFLAAAAPILNNINLTPGLNTDVVGNIYRSGFDNYNRDFEVKWSSDIGGGTGGEGYCIQWTIFPQIGDGGNGVGRVTGTNTKNAITFNTSGTDSFSWYKNGSLQDTEVVTNDFFRQELFFWGNYDHSASTFSLYYSTTNTKPAVANKVYNSFIFDATQVQMGFGGATSTATDNHEILSWSLTT